jgi:hypothetical protein
MAATSAHRVVVEILRNAPQGINKTKLYKAFYLAHLIYAQRAAGILTDWPIARLPKGPGISDGYMILDELKAAGTIEHRVGPCGPYTEHTYYLISPEDSLGSLAEVAGKAIADATAFILPRSASEVSDLSHGFSRSWIEGRDGDTLEIYTDLIDDDEFERRSKDLSQLERELGPILKDTV